jgi:hypothetical protein
MGPQSQARQTHLLVTPEVVAALEMEQLFTMEV